MTSSKGGQGIPPEMWDISLAEQLNTTPWDVRENATLWDVMRMREWVVAKNARERVSNQRARAEANRTNSSRSRRRR